MKTLQRLKETAFLRTFGLLKIPMIFWIAPRVLEMDDEGCSILVPLNYRTRNHLGSMYFGTLCAAADVAGGLLAMRMIQATGNRVNLVFKDFHADFRKRPDADAVFTSRDGAKVRALVERALASAERVEETVKIFATCPAKYGEEVVAEFALTISLKQKKK